MVGHLRTGGLAIVAFGATVGIAGAQGFLTRDLTTLEVDTAAFTTGEFEALPEPKRLMIACLECTRTAVVDLKLAPVDDETETRLRNGETSLADMEAACKAARGDVTCIGVEATKMGPAVGWMTMTRAGGDREVRTYELFLEGERLTIQAIAESREEADTLGLLAFEMLAPQIVGATN